MISTSFTPASAGSTLRRKRAACTGSSGTPGPGAPGWSTRHASNSARAWMMPAPRAPATCGPGQAAPRSTPGTTSGPAAAASAGERPAREALRRPPRRRAARAAGAPLEAGLAITVCHLPPGTSKWNKIEHRLFSQISVNWRGRPLTSHEVVVELIAATGSKTGLRVHAERDHGVYPTNV
jgi:Rhodopirellula transposase DDE domain